MKVKNKLHLV